MTSQAQCFFGILNRVLHFVLDLQIQPRREQLYNEAEMLHIANKPVYFSLFVHIFHKMELRFFWSSVGKPRTNVILPLGIPHIWAEIQNRLNSKRGYRIYNSIWSILRPKIFQYRQPGSLVSIQLALTK